MTEGLSYMRNLRKSRSWKQGKETGYKKSFKHGRFPLVSLDVEGFEDEYLEEEDEQQHLALASVWEQEQEKLE